jgi:hypothetical protein
MGERCAQENRRWIGVWRTDKSEADPEWLVSGLRNDPASKSAKGYFEFSPGYDHEGDGRYDSPHDVAPARAPWQELGDDCEIAWWIEDHGLRAPLAITPGVYEALLEGTTLPYLDYSKSTLELAQARHDPAFDCPDLYDSNDTASPIPAWLKVVHTLRELEMHCLNLDSPPPKIITSHLSETRTLKNAFVLCNPITGDLKDDLSFIKTLDLGTTSEAELQKLYPQPQFFINKAVAHMIQTQAPFDRQLNPLQFGILPPVTPATPSAGGPIYSLMPVITEFRISAGIAADMDSAKGDLYLVNKCYLELWNPYTLPLRIGDSAWPAALGYSDLKLEIENLPNFTVSNSDNGLSASGSVPDLAYRWSDYASGKNLLGGMVYLQSLPKDADYKGIGTRRDPLNLQLPSDKKDALTVAYRFSREPVRIHLRALDANGNEVSIFKAEIKNYPDFSITYQSGNKNRHAWFQRKRDSPDAKSGMNHTSLETPGYAFTLRFKMLDRNRSDWQRLLTEYEFRKPYLRVDLKEWDPTRVWETEPLLPFDFRVNSSNYDPANFDPQQFFSANDLFHYENASGSVGRRHRIVRAYDTPNAEKLSAGILHEMAFTPETASAYDYFFFSTLPHPDRANWDGKQALFNARLQPTDSQNPPKLESPKTAREVLLHNGFNFNSTDSASWVAVLSGQSFPASSFKARYEKGTTTSQAPAWFSPAAPLHYLHFSKPQSSVYSLTEQAKDPAYRFAARAQMPDYPNFLTAGPYDWRNQRQHPAFIQNIRELNPLEIDALAHALIRELKNYYAIQQHPPLSLRDFIEGKILQKAIDAVPALNLREDELDRIPTGSPAHFNADSLMQTLGPLAFLRSDTFTIHAVARCHNPINGDWITEARCSIQAQRFPDNHPTATDSGRFFYFYSL